MYNPFVDLLYLARVGTAEQAEDSRVRVSMVHGLSVVDPGILVEDI